MPQSTLAASFDDLRREIGRFLNWGRDPTNWTTDQVNDADDIMRSGLRMFYWPVDEGSVDLDHEWSFLKLPLQVTTITSQRTYVMPDDFSDISGNLHYSDNVHVFQIRVIHMDTMLANEQVGISTGRPRTCAFEATRQDGSEGQRWRMILHPIPDGVHELIGRYNVMPDKLLDTTREYPYGGAKFSEAIIEACLAAAEMKFNDQFGVHYEQFRKQLVAAIHRDGRRGNVGSTLGYNGDSSDRERALLRSDRRYQQQVTYNAG